MFTLGDMEAYWSFVADTRPYSDQVVTQANQNQVAGDSKSSENFIQDVKKAEGLADEVD